MSAFDLLNFVFESYHYLKFALASLIVILIFKKLIIRATNDIVDAFFSCSSPHKIFRNY